MSTTTEAPTSKERYRILDNLLTEEDLSRLFRRSKLTIMLWRKDGLPYVRIKGSHRDTIRFERTEVMVWARKNNKRIYLLSPQAA